jgi:hypothetical protein
MAKKWKAYPWPDRAEDPNITSSSQQNEQPEQQQQIQIQFKQEPPPQQQPSASNVVEVADEEEEIDVVGDSPAALAASKQTVTATCWGPSSPTAGATAPSPPPHSPEATRGSTILYNGKSSFLYLLFSPRKYPTTLF